MAKGTNKGMAEKERETVKEPAGGSIRPAADPSMQNVGLTKESELEKREGPFGPIGAETGKEKSGSSKKTN